MDSYIWICFPYDSTITNLHLYFVVIVTMKKYNINLYNFQLFELNTTLVKEL